MYNHGSVNIQTNYLKKKYQIVGNVFQTSIFCLYNEHTVLTYNEIKERLGIDDKDMKESILKLCAPKCQILLKENKKTPQFKPDEKIKLNPEFQNNNVKISVLPTASAAQMVQGRGNASSNDEVNNEVIKERSHVIEAVCVRIMKARKTE